MLIFNKNLLVLSLSLSLIACGGGGSNNSNSTSENNSSLIGAGVTVPMDGSDIKNTDDISIGENITGNDQVISSLTCTKGIPSGIPKINDSGMWSEPLYKFEFDYHIQNVPKGTIYTDPEYLNLYTYTLSDNIFYENVSTLNAPNTDTSEFYEGFFQYALNNNGLFSSNNAVRTSLGWPLSYVQNVSGTVSTISNFNDQCNLTVAPAELSYTKIDVSGKPISIILERDTSISPSIGYKYLPKSFGYYLDLTGIRNTEKNTAAYNALKTSPTVFPQGSYIYLRKGLNKKDSTIFFDDENSYENISLQDWARSTYPTIASSSWKLDKIGGYNVIYAIKIDGSHEDLGIDPAVEKDGKIFDAEWELIGPQIDYYGNSQGEYSLLNKSAKDAILTQIKNYYN